MNTEETNENTYASKAMTLLKNTYSYLISETVYPIVLFVIALLVIGLVIIIMQVKKRDKAKRELLHQEELKTQSELQAKAIEDYRTKLINYGIVGAIVTTLLSTVLIYHFEPDLLFFAQGDAKSTYLIAINNDTNMFSVKGFFLMPFAVLANLVFLILWLVDHSVEGIYHLFKAPESQK